MTIFSLITFLILLISKIRNLLCNCKSSSNVTQHSSTVARYSLQCSNKANIASKKISIAKVYVNKTNQSIANLYWKFYWMIIKIPPQLKLMQKQSFMTESILLKLMHFCEFTFRRAILFMCISLKN